MSDAKPKGGASMLAAALLWAGAQWAVEWFVYPDGTLPKAIAAAFGGLIAGWLTTGLLNRLARWGLGPKSLLVFGVLFGVAVASGAVKGLTAIFEWFRVDKLKVDWEDLKIFVLSWRVVPAAVLGALNGLYVRAKVSAKKNE